MKAYTCLLCEGTGHTARQCMAGASEGGGERVPQVLRQALDQQGVADTATACHPRLDTRASMSEVGPGEAIEQKVALLDRAWLETKRKARVAEQERLHESDEWCARFQDAFARIVWYSAMIGPWLRFVNDRYETLCPEQIGAVFTRNLDFHASGSRR